MELNLLAFIPFPTEPMKLFIVDDVNFLKSCMYHVRGVESFAIG